MISGTYILTDTIKVGVLDGVHPRLPARRRGGHGQERDRDDNDNSGERRAPTSRPRCSPRSRAAPGRGRRQAASRIRRGLVGHDGKVIARGGAPGLGVQLHPGRPAVQPADPGQRPLSGRADEIDIDAETASNQHFSLGAAGRGGRARRCAALHDRRHGQVRRRVVARRGDAGAVHAPDGAATVQQAEPVRPDQYRGQARRLAASRSSPRSGPCSRRAAR